jgi:hypothetical protein
MGYPKYETVEATETADIRPGISAELDRLEKVQAELSDYFSHLTGRLSPILEDDSSNKVASDGSIAAPSTHSSVFVRLQHLCNDFETLRSRMGQIMQRIQL